MGKYLRKAKITGDVAVMEVVSQSSLGVRTRAKTLALQKLQSTTPQSPPPRTPESSYLQLRSRRLEKLPPPISDAKRQPGNQQFSAARNDGGKNPNPNSNCSENPSSKASSRLGMRSASAGSVGSASIGCSRKREDLIGEFETRESREGETEDGDDLGIEPSCGENNLDFECMGRSTRESTPCSLIKELEDVGTPCSTTRQTGTRAPDRRSRNGMQRNVPIMHEIEEFFARAEQEEHRLFLEKYNFDVVNDLPLPGRYEWVKVDP